ncbi:hypothetical protein Rsub_13104 [Raphidocelis subcapitata]|uniref:Methyltransferase domain-containing protein n=1 Tax=Raphidocelis subcapitata TaxID=307507 RepID=A0A2V0PQ69_9CHLO|nr:hypothetical protein Rsub_13104 [Raphidocelis subcapitata]|eukprot:GBG00334.1 hypothetical protein Rsub_13104 [Raphidocelis subcapitata]
MARTAVLPFALALAALAPALARAGWHQCGAQAAFSGPYGYHALANLSDFRSGLISAVWPFVTSPEKEASLWKRFDPFNPFIACPPEQPLRRVGSAADGGKMLCDLSRLQPPCVIYSLGSNGDYSFEREMLDLTKCDIHTFDCTFDGRSQSSRHFYHKTCLGLPSSGPLFKEYDTVLAELGHGRVDFLKIDIEGHEPSVLQSLTTNKGPLPRQVAIEMHMRSAVGAVAPATTADMAVLFYHLATLGYGVVSREDNAWGVKGCCAEFTFLLVEEHHRHQRLASVVGRDGQRVITPIAGGGTGARSGDATAAMAADTPALVTVGGVGVVGKPLPPGLTGAAPAGDPGSSVVSLDNIATDRHHRREWGLFGRRLMSALLSGGGGSGGGGAEGLREPNWRVGARSFAVGTWAGPPESE